MEAQSQALACVATHVSAIPEFLIDGETGLLTEPDDPAAFAAALTTLITAPKRRAGMGAAGFKRLQSHFQADLCIRPLARRFGLADAGATETPTAKAGQ